MTQRCTQHRKWLLFPLSSISDILRMLNISMIINETVIHVLYTRGIRSSLPNTQSHRIGLYMTPVHKKKQREKKKKKPKENNCC